MKKQFLCLLILFCAGCGSLTQGYVVKKQYRPSGTKWSLLPKVKVVDGRMEFWIYLKLRDKTSKYAVLLQNDRGFFLPVMVQKEMFYELRKGDLVQVQKTNGIVYLELLKRNVLN